MNDVLEIDADPRAVELGDHHGAAQDNDPDVLTDDDRWGHEGDDESQTADAASAQPSAVGANSAPESGTALVADDRIAGAAAATVRAGQAEDEGGAGRDCAAETVLPYRFTIWPACSRR